MVKRKLIVVTIAVAVYAWRQNNNTHLMATFQDNTCTVVPESRKFYWSKVDEGGDDN